MRKFLILIIITFSLSILYSQQNERFSIVEFSKWKTIYYHELTKDADNKAPDEYYYYETEGDTIIGDHNYYKVYKSGIMLFVAPSVSYHKIYQAAIRSQSEQVYCVKKGKSNETLLYDFNLRIGDTVKAEVANGQVIIDIDTLQDGRRVYRFFMSFRCGETLIEGIGSNSDLFEMNRCVHSGRIGMILTNFLVNNSQVFGGDIVDDYNVIRDDKKDYQPLKSSVWRINTFNYSPSFSNDAQYIYVSGDTVINGISYYCLKKNGIITANNKTPKIYCNQYYGAIRAEGTKLFYIPKDLDNELLEYDFNLKVGDRVKSLIFKDSVVIKIDTIADGRKRFYLDTSRMKLFLLEGIGNNVSFMDLTNNEYFQCYSENGRPVLYNFNCTDCINNYTNKLWVNDALYIFHKPGGIYSLSGYVDFNKMWYLSTPSFLKADIENDGYIVTIQAYYNLGEPDNINAHEYIVPISSISLGSLSKGKYRLVYMVHTIENSDTTFLYKMNSIEFIVGQNVEIQDNYKINELLISPNPARDRVYVRINNTKSYFNSVSIFDSNGKKMYEKKLPASTFSFEETLDVKKFDNGLYLIVVQSVDKNKIFKLIISK